MSGVVAKDKTAPLEQIMRDIAGSNPLLSGSKLRCQIVALVCEFEREPEPPNVTPERMKTFRFISTALIAGLHIAPYSTDRLFQVELTELPKIRSILLKKLGPTPFDCGRMMAQPAFLPEFSVSIYSRSREGGQAEYFITYIEADQSVWQATDIGRHPHEAEKIKIRRIDSRIPQRTAELVRQAWIGMLSGNQRPKPWTEVDATRSTDGTVVEFSIQVSRAKTLYGETDDADELLRKRTKTFVDLAKTLVDYCKAKQTDRGAIASKIDRKATRLLEMLNQK